MSDYFQLFDLKPGFLLDVQQLGGRYRELMRQVHPDRFAAAPEREQRLALEQAAVVNEAYQVLRSASRRALYLMAQQGQEIPLEGTVQDAEFLMQQMQWREELETLQEGADAAGVVRFRKRLQEEQQALQHAFADCWDLPDERCLAERLVRRMQFLEKLGQEVQRLEERLDD